MHPNSHLHQYLQQSSLGGGQGQGQQQGANNPLSAAGNNMNALSQHFPAMNNRSTNGQGGNNTDPFAYSQMMNNNNNQPPQLSQQQPMSANFAAMQQQQQQQQHEQKLQQLDEEKIYGLVVELLNPATREQALLDLSKKREQYEDLALVLWYSYGN
jgi:CCR4-NOT transcription complex subunit 9